MNASGFRRLVRGIGAMIGVSVRMVQPRGVEPGYHLKPEHYDLVGGGLIAGIAVASLYATLRAIRLRDIL